MSDVTSSSEALTPTGRIVIAGGTGFLGLNLARALDGLGCEIVLISRNRPTVEHPGRHETWDGHRVGEWAKALDGATAVVNLAGRTVDCIKTPDHCDQILRSRVEATDALGRAMREIDTPPPVWVQMSTAHIYGDSLDRVCDEDAAFGYGLAPFVGEAWEGACSRGVLPGMRNVILRTSFVLGRHGGALSRLARIVRWGLGGKVGHGRQGMSWIHERDMSRIFVRAIADEAMEGAYVATAPNPVSNVEFMRELRRAIGMPIGLPAAQWMVRIGAPLVMRTDPELALYGRYCVPSRLAAEGFEFEFTEVGAALRDLYSSRRTES